MTKQICCQCCLCGRDLMEHTQPIVTVAMLWLDEDDHRYAHAECVEAAQRTFRQNVTVKDLSNGSLLFLRLGQYVRETREDEAFSKVVEDELVRRGVITLIPTGTEIHWGKISEQARYDISEYFRDEVWGIFTSTLCRWQKAHNSKRRVL